MVSGYSRLLTTETENTEVARGRPENHDPAAKGKPSRSATPYPCIGKERLARGNANDKLRASSTDCPQLHLLTFPFGQAFFQICGVRLGFFSQHERPLARGYGFFGFAL